MIDTKLRESIDRYLRKNYTGITREDYPLWKGLEEEFGLYESVEKISSKLLSERKQLSKPICCNVDFYSGFVYSMLGIPVQLYTPIFAIARVAGWSAHRMEELINEGKLIRPAYKYVGHHRAYRRLEERD